MALPNTVLLRTRASYPLLIERISAAAITPGDLVEITSANLVQRHSSAGGNAGRMIAGNPIRGDYDIDDNFASGDQVPILQLNPGDEVYCTLAVGENVSIGAALDSKGTGHLRALAGTGPESLFGYALEAVNATSAAARIRVRVA